jgi:hypothetical protein
MLLSERDLLPKALEEERGSLGLGASAARALSSRALSMTRGLRGALGAKTPW